MNDLPCREATFKKRIGMWNADREMRQGKRPIRSAPFKALQIVGAARRPGAQDHAPGQNGNNDLKFGQNRT